MRKFFLLVTTAAAIALTLSGRGFAEGDQTPRASRGGSPPATTGENLLFDKDTSQAQPIQPPASPQAATAQPAEQAKTGLSAEDATLADQLKDLVEHKLHQYVPREQDRAGVLTFYRQHDFAPIWVSAGKATSRQQQAAAFLQGVAADGLDPADYPTPRFDKSDPAMLAADELAMTNSVVTFARQASIGRVAFSRVSGAVWFDQKAPDPADVLSKVAGSSDVHATLDAYNPQSKDYKALKAELAAVRAGKDMAPADQAASSEPKTASKKKGKKKQHEAKAHETKGHVSRESKISTIIANMERWRWMPHDLGSAYVMVNIPDFTLKVVKDGKTVWRTKIVAGKPGTHATPLLTETMKYITVNPTWNVPPSIIRNEYLPALAQDPNALARIGLRIGHNSDGSLRVYQPPGERNALGRIRFNFPNRFLVYQHDTPDKHLFDKSVRAFSHGCMRVQNPDEYAEVLLNISQPEDHYTAERIKSLYGHTERTIKFKNPIPVYITYQTAFVDDGGKPQSRADIYGLDKEITNILDGDRRVADIPIHRNYGSGSKPVMASVPSSRSSREPAYQQTYGWGSSGWGSNGWGSNDDWNWRSAYRQRDRFSVW